MKYCIVHKPNHPFISVHNNQCSFSPLSPRHFPLGTPPEPAHHLVRASAQPARPAQRLLLQEHRLLWTAHAQVQLLQQPPRLRLQRRQQVGENGLACLLALGSGGQPNLVLQMKAVACEKCCLQKCMDVIGYKCRITIFLVVKHVLFKIMYLKVFTVS